MKHHHYGFALAVAAMFTLSAPAFANDSSWTSPAHFKNTTSVAAIIDGSSDAIMKDTITAAIGLDMTLALIEHDPQINGYDAIALNGGAKQTTVIIHYVDLDTVDMPLVMNDSGKTVAMGPAGLGADSDSLIQKIYDAAATLTNQMRADSAYQLAAGLHTPSQLGQYADKLA
ncbi:MAG: hypothetical protein WDN10_01690 [bacterium]